MAILLSKVNFWLLVLLPALIALNDSAQGKPTPGEVGAAEVSTDKLPPSTESPSPRRSCRKKLVTPQETKAENASPGGELVSSINTPGKIEASVKGFFFPNEEEIKAAANYRVQQQLEHGIPSSNRQSKGDEPLMQVQPGNYMIMGSPYDGIKIDQVADENGYRKYLQ